MMIQLFIPLKSYNFPLETLTNSWFINNYESDLIWILNLADINLNISILLWDAIKQSSESNT